MGNAANAMRDIKKKVVAATITVLENTSDDIQSTARDAVHRWRNRPDFSETVYNQTNTIEYLIRPDGDKKKTKIFSYIDLGTKGPYLIPKLLTPDRFLRFRSGYSAFTQPVARYNQGSGKSFGSYVTKKQVTHPGIKARKFLETFMNEIIPALEVRVQSEITKKLA